MARSELKTQLSQVSKDVAKSLGKTVPITLRLQTGNLDPVSGKPIYTNHNVDAIVGAKGADSASALSDYTEVNNALVVQIWEPMLVVKIEDKVVIGDMEYTIRSVRGLIADVDGSRYKSKLVVA